MNTLSFTVVKNAYKNEPQHVISSNVLFRLV